MKYVIELGELVRVSNQAVECEACGKWKSEKTEFPKERQFPYMYCLECLESSTPKEIDESRRNLNILKKSNEYYDKTEPHRFTIGLQDYSVAVSELRRYLDSLPPDARIVVTQEGYYAEGKFCDVCFPDKPEFKLPDETPIYVLANSSQHY
jgi:hypothetical protein